MKHILNLNLDQILEVKEDLQAHYDGYKFIYVLDTHELINYYFPFFKLLSPGEKNSNKQEYNKGTDEEKAQMGIAYNFFFTDKCNKIFFPPEYYHEIINVKMEIDERISKAKNILDIIEQSFLKLQIPARDIRQKIENNLELIVYTLIEIEQIASLRERNAPELTSLFRNQLNDQDKEIYKQYTSFNYRSSVNERVMDEYSVQLDNQIKNYLGKTISKNPKGTNHLEQLLLKDKLRNTKNTFVDVHVIDRIFQFQTYLLSSNKRKLKIKYLSSAPSKNQILFKLNSFQTFYGREPGEKQSILRNINQIFLLNFLIRQKKESEKFDPLSYIENVIYDLISGNKKITVEIVDEKDKVENYLYQDIYNKKYTETENAVKDSLTGIYKYIQDVNKQLRNSPLFQSDLNGEQSKFYNFSKNPTLYYFIKPGKDIVKSPFQHFPSFLFWAKEFNISKKFFKLLDFLSDQNNVYSFEITEAEVDPPSSILLDIKGIRTMNRILYDELFNVLKSVLNILCKTSKELEVIRNIYAYRTNTNEFDKIYEDEKECYEGLLISKKSYDRYTSHIEFENPQIREDIIRELDYLILAFSRRLKTSDQLKDIYKKDSAESVYRDLELKNPEDFRFLHLKILWMIDDYYNGNFGKYFELNSKIIDNINLCVASLKKELKKNEDSSERKNILSKTILALSNSEANTYVEYLIRRAERRDVFSVNDLEIIQKIRFLINNIKSECSTLRIQYDSIFSFNHTEAALEFLESYYIVCQPTIDESELQFAQMKLNHAENRTRIFKNDFVRISKEFLKIEHLIFSLRGRIIKL